MVLNVYVKHEERMVYHSWVHSIVDRMKKVVRVGYNSKILLEKWIWQLDHTSRKEIVQKATIVYTNMFEVEVYVDVGSNLLRL
jgi:hypothetical protein